MSVSIGWIPNNPKKLNYIDGGSSFLTVLENAFGGVPITLSHDDIGKLEGIYSCGHDGASQLITAILEQESIIVEAQW